MLCLRVHRTRNHDGDEEFVHSPELGGCKGRRRGQQNGADWDTGWHYDQASGQLLSRGDTNFCLDRMSRTGKGGDILGMERCDTPKAEGSQVWLFSLKK